MEIRLQSSQRLARRLCEPGHLSSGALSSLSLCWTEME